MLLQGGQFLGRILQGAEQLARVLGRQLPRDAVEGPIQAIHRRRLGARPAIVRLRCPGGLLHLALRF